MTTAWGGSHQLVAAASSATNPKVDAMFIDASHTHTVSGTTGGISANHTHNVSGTTGGTTQSGTNSNTGSGSAHNNLQPYITCYMWKRVG